MTFFKTLTLAAMTAAIALPAIASAQDWGGNRRGYGDEPRPTYGAPNYYHSVFYDIRVDDSRDRMLFRNAVWSHRIDRYEQHQIDWRLKAIERRIAWSGDRMSPAEAMAIDAQLHQIGEDLTRD